MWILLANFHIILDMLMKKILSTIALIASAFVSGCGGGGSGGGNTPAPAPVPTLAPADFSGIWSGSYNGTALSYAVTQTGSSYTMVRTTPLLAGLTYAGTINGNVAAVTGYINGSPAFTNSWTLLNSTTSSMVATGCTPPPGYGCGAPNGTAITLTRPLPAPPVVAPTIPPVVTPPVLPPVVIPPVYTAPTRPFGLQAISGIGQATVSWAPLAGAISYNLYWGTTAGISLASTKITNVASPYVHTGLIVGSTYYYRVSAVTAAGETALSDETFTYQYTGGNLVGISTAIVGSMTTARFNHTATLLLNGKVLVTGGTGTAGALSSAEMFDPITSSFIPTTTPMTSVRDGHTATLMSNGKVLITGGRNALGATLSSAELYDPVTGGFTATGNMWMVRSAHTATLLANGMVLIVGGMFGISGSVEIYDPVTGAFTPTGNMINGRTFHTATLLPNGTVLVVGGYPLAISSSSELYDPVTGSFTATGSMTNMRYYHQATLLPNGKVLVVGGSGTLAASYTPEIYDLATGVFSVTGSSTAWLYQPSTVLLGNGKVFAMTSQPIATEIYDPATASFSISGSLIAGRQSAVLLHSGKVLITGGSSGAPLGSAELFQ